MSDAFEKVNNKTEKSCKEKKSEIFELNTYTLYT